MWRCVQELISNLNQESLLLRHIHLICQRIIPEGSGYFFLLISTCINALIFVCLFRLRDDSFSENQERIPLVYKCLWWRPWKHARISWQLDRTQFAESSQWGWRIRKKLCGHWIRHRCCFGGCLNLWSIQSPRLRITGKPSQQIYFWSCNEEDFSKSMSDFGFFPSSSFGFQRHHTGSSQAWQCLLNTQLVHEKRNIFSEINRWIRCQKEQRLCLHFGTGWICGPKFTSLKYVPAANPWIALSFSAIKIGAVIRTSWSNSKISGIFHGSFIVQSRHPCKGPAKKKQPGFSFVIKAMFSDYATSFKT